MGFCCPVCKGKLKREGNALRCEKNHSFDFSRSGYVNLLQSNKMHSKMPGDNKEMVAARTRFLNAGYYEPLRDAICETVAKYLPKGGVLLDAGCGEGYYTMKIAETVGENGEVLGTDISNTALNVAAKRDKRTQYAVASSFGLPAADKSVDVLCEIFSPFCKEEFMRVLKKGGVLIEVIPAARHLFGLKSALYEEPYENKVKPYELEGFTFLGKTEVQRTVTLTDPELIFSLFMMTPYAYRTPAEAVEKLRTRDHLETELAFEILAYRLTK